MTRLSKFALSLIALLLIALATVLPNNVPSASACASFPTIIANKFLNASGSTINYLTPGVSNRTLLLTARNDTCGTLDVKVQSGGELTGSAAALFVKPFNTYAYGYGGATIGTCSFVYTDGGKGWCYTTMPAGSEVDFYTDVLVQSNTQAPLCYNGCYIENGETWWTGHGVKWFTSAQYFSLHY